jgi:hypothetical protein
MNVCDICLQPCHSHDLLCQTCRETLKRLAGMWVERSNRKTGEAGEPVQRDLPAAVPWQFSAPSASRLESALRAIPRFLSSLACRLSLLPRSAELPPGRAAAAPARRFGRYLNL